MKTKLKFDDPTTQKIYDFLCYRLRIFGKTITYQGLGEHFGIPWEHDSLGIYLGEISQKTFDKFGVFLSAMVVRSDSGFPGQGFPEFAWRLGVRINSTTWYQEEMKRLKNISHRL